MTFVIRLFSFNLEKPARSAFDTIVFQNKMQKVTICSNSFVLFENFNEMKKTTYVSLSIPKISKLGFEFQGKMHHFFCFKKTFLEMVRQFKQLCRGILGKFLSQITPFQI